MKLQLLVNLKTDEGMIGPQVFDSAVCEIPDYIIRNKENTKIITVLDATETVAPAAAKATKVKSSAGASSSATGVVTTATLATPARPALAKRV